MIFDVSRIDERYPSLGESLSWPELWTRYRTYDTRDNFILMRRRNEPLPYSIDHISSKTIHLNEKIGIDPELRKNLWVRIGVRTSLIGKIASFLYKIPRLFIEVEMNHGESRRFRLLSNVADAGFLLSPLIETSKEFAIYSGSSAGYDLITKQIKSFKIYSEIAGGIFFDDEINLEFYQISFPRRDNYRGIIDTKYNSLSSEIITKLHKNSSPESAPNSVMNGVDGLFLRAHAPFISTIEIPENLTRFGFAFEVEQDAWQNPTSNSDGVELRWTAIHDAEHEEVLYSQVIAPRNNADQRGRLNIKVDMQGNEARKLKLEIIPRNNSAYDNTSLDRFWWE